MDEVWASVRRDFLSHFDADGHLRLRNRVGIFVAPHPHVVARSVIEITTKPTDVEFHAYIHLPLNHLRSVSGNFGGNVWRSFTFGLGFHQERVPERKLLQFDK